MPASQERHKRHGLNRIAGKVPAVSRGTTAREGAVYELGQIPYFLNRISITGVETSNVL